jgi:putative acetyltransferase
MIVRSERPHDAPAVADLNRRAFGGPAEAALVDRLRAAGLAVASLVAEADEPPNPIVGHILFSRLPIDTPRTRLNAVALAPMAVAPERQRQGIGSALVREGLRVCRSAGESIVVVVGHPEYYPRFGFSAALARRLLSPYSGDAFMALALRPGALDEIAGGGGVVRYPPAFDGL